MIRLDLPVRETPRPKVKKRNASFTGAGVGRLFGDWVARRQGPTQELKYELAVLRHRAREREKNDPLVARYFRLLEKNVIGSRGITLRVRGRTPKGELDVETNKAIQEDFRLWSKRGICETSGFFSMVGLQAMGIRTAARDGELFARHIEGFDNPWGYAVQLLDADQFDESREGIHQATGGIITASVERDRWNRILAYHAWSYHPDERFGSRELIRIPAEQMLHLYRPRRIGAARGETWLAPVLKGIHDIERATEAVVINLRVSAAKMGWIQRDAEDGGDEEEGESSEDNSSFEADPGIVDYLDPGETFVGWDPKFPDGEFGPFKDSILHDYASGLDIAHHSLTGNLGGANYSSLRTGLLDERDSYRQLHGWYIDTLLQPIYERYLRQAVLVGRVKVPRSDYRPYLETRWRPRGWDWIDPQKEVEAKARAKAYGFTSASRIAAEQGEDYAEILEEQEEDGKLEKKHGITPMRPSTVTPDGGSNDGNGSDDDTGTTVGDGKATDARHRHDRPLRALAAS